MECPLCSIPLRQHLLQPSVSVISCPSEKCVFPFNLSIQEMNQQKLLITDLDTNDVMNMMQRKMVNEASVDEKIASFISKEDHELD